MHYEPPFIQTDTLYSTPEQQYDMGTLRLQQLLNSRTIVDQIPIYEPDVIYSTPGVTYTPHVSAGYYDPQIMMWFHQGTAPPIIRGNSAGTLYGIRQAANPMPTYSQTGSHVSLRSPGINEGV